jgi:hypothetical protein
MRLMGASSSSWREGLPFRPANRNSGSGDLFAWAQLRR